MTEDVSASELDYVQIDRALVARAIQALDTAKRSGLKVVTAESCTGGLVAMVLSERGVAGDFSTRSRSWCPNNRPLSRLAAWHPTDAR